MTAGSPAVHRLSPPAERTLLVLHGLEDTHGSWRPVARALGAGWGCVGADMPWHAGNSYQWRWDAAPGDWVAKTLSQLDRPPDLVLAHSFSANAVLDFLVRDQGPGIPAAVLLSPFFHGTKQRATWQTWDAARRAFERQIRAGISVRSRSRIGADDLELVISRTLARVGVDGFVAVFDEYLRSGTLDLGAVSIPVSVVVGGNERTRCAECAALAAALPNSSLVIEPDRDHYLHLTDPERVAEHCRKALPPALADRACYQRGASGCW